ncbi:hypothetical protein [Mammaliicoccus sciuri]|uniref:hypothetical protein n=2 Tax=Mammaliicoccus sciuri TaxID=1296 RepID=UPI001950EF58|nr:hypothetical protein [Mammaliicoccus sciuri]
MLILEKIGQWLMPYKYINKDRLEEELARLNGDNHSTKSKKKIKTKKKPKLSIEEEKQRNDFLERGEIGVSLTTITKNMDREDALSRLKLSGYDVAYYFHNHQYHQLAVKFQAKSSWRYHKRNNAKRKGFKPLIYHKVRKNEDYTHMIPVGFHGSENDERLLIGYASNINRGPLKKFEKHIIDLNNTESVLWFVSIENQNDGSVKWHSIVWDEDGCIIKEETFHDTTKFVWIS